MSGRPLVSVVVPTRNSAGTLRACLESIAGQSYPGIETVLVDRDSTDGTPELAADMGVRVLSAGPERSAQRNVGAREAGGRWVFFVDSDMVLTPNVVASCVRRGNEETALIVPETGFSGSLLTRARALEKQCYVGNEAVEAARFFPRERFLAVGGYDESLVAGEDWDLTDRWRASGGRIGRIEANILHDDRRLRFRSLLVKRFKYGRLFVDYMRKDAGAAVGHLKWGRFLPRIRILVREPLVAMALLTIRGLEALFFGAGLLARWVRPSRASAEANPASKGHLARSEASEG